MWLSRLLIAALLAGLVNGCGYRPLYGSDGGSAVVEELSRIKVVTIDNRIGQQLHNLLLDRLNPEGRPDVEAYRLDVRATVTTSELGLRFTEIATRAQLTLQSTFSLVDLETGKILVSGHARSINSYNIPDSEYAKVVAEQDAAERAVREVSDEIKTRLSLYFRK